MPLLDASQQALIKASYKDTFYISILRNQLNSLCQQILGDKFWILWRKELEVLADLSYFLLTTVSGSQTLGEEYVCTIQVDSSRKKIPTKLQSSFQVFLQCTSPYLIEKVIKESQAKVLKVQGLSSIQKKKINIFLSFVHKLSPVIEQLHTLLFYLEGVYISLSKRIAGVKHILVRPYDDSESDTTTFRWLAIIGAVQVFCKIVDLFTELKKVSSAAVYFCHKCAGSMNYVEYDNNATLSQLFNTKENAEKELMHKDKSTISANININSHYKCILCLESVQDISSTQCGHMFCWKCIIDWCSIKSECPTCREYCPPSRVVRLHHYDTS